MSVAHQQRGALPTFPCHELGGSLPRRKQSLTDTLHARTFVYAIQDAVRKKERKREKETEKEERINNVFVG